MPEPPAFDPSAEVRELESQLGIQKGFFDRLLVTDDDWSFIIKMHALIEAAVSHLLAESCGDKRLVEPFTRIELSNAVAGKLAFAEALGVLDSQERAFIRKMSEIRNKFAHDIRNAEMTLPGFLESLDANQFREYAKALGPVGDFFVAEDTTVPSATFFKDNPRLSIWLRGLFLIAFAQAHKSLASDRRALAAEALELLRKKRTLESGT